MNYFLVDYENVKVAGFDGVVSLTENDVVVIFYSVNADNLTFGLHRRMNESKAEFRFQKVSVGEKNALDFQLCSYLGYLIRDTMTCEDTEEKCKYYIVSNDRGYSVLSEYWKQHGTDVVIVRNLAKAPPKIAEKVNCASNSPGANNGIGELEKKLQAVLPDKADASDVAEIITHYKTKQGVNNGLTKKFPTHKVGPIYKAIKSLIADKKGS